MDMLNMDVRCVLNMGVRFVIVLSTLLLIMVDCAHLGDQQCDENQVTEVQTYNVNLMRMEMGGAAPGEEALTLAARTERVAAAVRGSSADVLCLTGVSHEREMRQIVQEAQETFSYSFSFIHQGDSIPREDQSIDSCSDFPNQVALLVECMQVNCPPTRGSGQLDLRGDSGRCLIQTCSLARFLSPRCTECLMKPCQTELLESSPELQSCLARSLGSGACTSWLPGDAANLATKGLLLLSRKEMVSTSAVSFEYFTSDPTHSNPGYLSAEIHDVGTVVCTQLTNNDSLFIDYTSGLPSWTAMNAWEVMSLYHELTTVQGDLIVAGDFGNGPELPEQNIIAENTGNYDLSKAFGFESALTQNEENIQCSVCAFNTLAEITTRSSNNYLTDHIFVRKSCVGALEGAKVLVNTMDRESGPVEGDFSDHYGVSASVRSCACLPPQV